MPNSHILVRIAVASGALVLSVGLAACGGTSGTSSNTPPAAATASTSAQPARRFNDADVRFRQMMIPHHRQAIAMAELAGDRAQNADVKALAQQIKNEQSPGIQTMTGFLQAWGAPVPSGDEPIGGMSGTEDGGANGGAAQPPVMMTSNQMSELSGATGAAFDHTFLQMMITHHRSAVTKAQRELAEGVNDQAKTLASTIVATQNAGIARMQQLLKSV